MTPWYKSWYFWIFVLIIVCGALGTIVVVTHENDRNKQEEISTQSSLL